MCCPPLFGPFWQHLIVIPSPRYTFIPWFLDATILCFPFSLRGSFSSPSIAGFSSSSQLLIFESPQFCTWTSSVVIYSLDECIISWLLSIHWWHQVYIFSLDLSPEFQTHILLPTRYPHRLDALNDRHLLFHSSGGRKSKSKLLSCSVSGETSSWFVYGHLLAVTSHSFS